MLTEGEAKGEAEKRKEEERFDRRIVPIFVHSSTKPKEGRGHGGGE